MTNDHALSGIQDPADMHAYVQHVWGDANSCMSPEDRANAVVLHVNEQLAGMGIPPLGWYFNPSRGQGAALIFWEWRIEMGDTEYQMESADFASVEQQAHQVSTVYHEARHAEQWFRIARARAGLGEAAADITATTGVPDHVAQLASLMPLQPHDAVAYQAEEWYESVYGSGKQHRHEVLHDMEHRYGDYLALPEEKDAWAAQNAVDEHYRQYTPGQSH